MKGLKEKRRVPRAARCFGVCFLGGRGWFFAARVEREKACGARAARLVCCFCFLRGGWCFAARKGRVERHKSRFFLLFMFLVFFLFFLDFSVQL